jgi:hypothetical protein
MKHCFYARHFGAPGFLSRKQAWTVWELLEVLRESQTIGHSPAAVEPERIILVTIILHTPQSAISAGWAEATRHRRKPSGYGEAGS